MHLAHQQELIALDEPRSRKPPQAVPRGTDQPVDRLDAHAKLGLGGHLVDSLTARPARAGKGESQLGRVDPGTRGKLECADWRLHGDTTSGIWPIVVTVLEARPRWRR